VAFFRGKLGASPGLKAGRGLKRLDGDGAIVAIVRASPGLKAGRGLKLLNSLLVFKEAELRPASRPGAD